MDTAEEQIGIDDLIKLKELNESSILDSLRTRFKKDRIYTCVGSILIWRARSLIS